MGVPDLLKFAARAAPAALCRLPSSAHTDTAASTTDAAATAMTFDYILVDATNAAHTVGLDAVYAFLSSPHVTARVAVVFAVDAARDRAGTARQHRQTHLLVGDLDVKVRELCVRLQRCYRERARLHSDDKVDGTCTSPTSALSLPVVLMSGRDVAGEADYKILDIQRGVVAATMLQQQQQQSHVCARRMPTFLFVSEDSDVLCGALCGPCAHHVCIATNLHDTLLELCVLRVSHVLAYLARGTGVMSRLRTARAHAQTQAISSSPQQQQQQLVTTTSVARKGKDDNHKKQRYTPGQDGMCAPDAVAGACAVAVANDRDDVVRRRKVDGPMVATGVRIELHDSSDDEADTTATASAQQQQQPQRASQQTHAQEAAHDEQPQCSAPDASMCTRAARCAPGTGSGEVAAAEAEAAAAAAMHDSCVDLVFLFVLVMGNGAHVAPLLPGVTKVDMASCWRAYCKARHASMTTTTATTLLRVAHAPHTDANDDNNSSVDHNATASRCSLTLSCALLRDILCSVHYADTHARLVSAEERARVLAVLSAAIAATLRYVVGCNVASGAALRDSLLDSRVTAYDAHDDGDGSGGGVGAGDMARTHTPLAGSNYSSSGGSSTVAPSLAAVLFVLQQAPTYTFDVRLRGTATAATTTTTTTTPSTSVRNHMHGNDYTRAPHMQLDVRESLVLPCAAPAATMSWAVQHGGGNARRLSLYDVMAAAAAAATPSSTATAATRLRRMSVADTVLQLQQASSRQQQQCVQTTHASHHVTSPRLPLRNSNSSSSNVSVTAQHVLVALQTAWQQSMQSALPLLRRPTTTTTLQMTTTDHKATATPHDGCDKDRLRANGTHTAAPCAAAAADDNNDDDMDAVVDDHDDSSSGLGDSRKSNDDMTARYVYSFELRRMAPILQQSSSSTRQERTAHTRSNNNNNNNNDTSTVAVHARLAALGVSYDYATTATAAAVTATDATLPPRTRKRTHSSSLSSSSSAMHVAGARAAVADASSGVADTASSTRRRRPGKRERMTLLRRASATENDNDTMHARSNNKTTTTTATTATTDTAQAKRKRHATTTNTSATTTKTT